MNVQPQLPIDAPKQNRHEEANPQQIQDDVTMGGLDCLGEEPPVGMAAAPAQTFHDPNVEYPPELLDPAPTISNPIPSISPAAHYGNITSPFWGLEEAPIEQTFLSAAESMRRQISAMQQPTMNSSMTTNAPTESCSTDASGDPWASAMEEFLRQYPIDDLSIESIPWTPLNEFSGLASGSIPSPQGLNDMGEGNTGGAPPAVFGDQAIDDHITYEEFQEHADGSAEGRISDEQMNEFFHFEAFPDDWEYN